MFIEQSGERKASEFAALEVGQRVEARFTGPVRESYPVQADAAEITIIKK
ncbi:MAG: YobA family protein [Acidobacteria bacterium]|nr:YobA family protein [Acidobacteriota bacterium]